MGCNMETCNIECCKCIEKKDTQLNPISSKIYKSNSLNKKRIHKIRSFELSQILIIQKDNKENKEQEKNILITLEEKIIHLSKNIMKIPTRIQVIKIFLLNLLKRV